MAEPAELRRAVDDYLASCRARGLSRSTLQAYSYALVGEFLPFADRLGIQRPEELNQAIVDSFSTKLLEEGGRRGRLSRDSVRSYSRSLNLFLAWLERERASVGARAQLPRTRRKIKAILSRAQCQQLEDAAATERDKLVIRLMCDTAMREGELCALRIDGLIEQGVGRERAYFIQVPVEGKTGERRSSISASLHARLVHYRRVLRPRAARSNLLFLAERKQAGDYPPLGTSGVYAIVKEAADRAGLQNIHPHLLRSSAISWLALRGIDPGIISLETGAGLQVILDHYLHPTDEQRWRALQHRLDEG